MARRDLPGGRVIVAVLALLVLLIGYSIWSSRGSEEKSTAEESPVVSQTTSAPEQTGVSAQQEKPSGPLDTIPLSDLIPARNIGGLLWDYQDELLDFHLEDRPGSTEGRAGHWSNPGDFSPGAMVRLFRYTDNVAAKRSRDEGFTEPDLHSTDTTIAGETVRLMLDSTHLEDYSTIAAANIEHVSGRTEVEIHATQTIQGIAHQLADDLERARQDAIALFTAIIEREHGADAGTRSTDVSPAQRARREQRRQYIDSLSSEVSSRRSTELPETQPSAYIPPRLEGFTRVESYSAPDDELEVWEGATSGWLSFWEAADVAPTVAVHDLTIDVYRFDTPEQAKAAVYWDMQKTGDLRIEAVSGLPVVITTDDHAGGADVFLGYHQGTTAVRIHALKDMIRGDTEPKSLRPEAFRAFRAVVSTVSP